MFSSLKKGKYLLCDEAEEDWVDIVGESFYHNNLLYLALGKKGPDGVEIDCEAHLIPDPDNPYDANAVRVEIDGKKVGHLPREMTSVFHNIMAIHRTDYAVCGAEISAGWKNSQSEGDFCVQLNTKWPPWGVVKS